MNSPSPKNSQIVLIKCTDEVGLVARVTSHLYKLNLSIVSNWEFVDAPSKTFFMRTEFLKAENTQTLKQDLSQLLPKDAEITLINPRKKRVVLLATKETHCLGDLLLRAYDREMNAEILSVIANHNDLKPLVDKFGIPFQEISHQGLDREAHEQALIKCIDEHTPDYIVLAKYMRILTPAFVETYPHKIINIHHSFLPAFIGANPYQQAYNRGVKIIGATAHFVNHNLDEGPIITQNIVPVDHTHGAIDMRQSGRDIEKITLAKALKLVFEDRVFVSGNRTVIFE